MRSEWGKKWFYIISNELCQISVLREIKLERNPVSTINYEAFSNTYGFFFLLQNFIIH